MSYSSSTARQRIPSTCLPVRTVSQPTPPDWRKCSRSYRVFSPCLSESRSSTSPWCLWICPKKSAAYERASPIFPQSVPRPRSSSATSVPLWLSGRFSQCTPLRQCRRCWDRLRCTTGTSASSSPRSPPYPTASCLCVPWLSKRHQGCRVFYSFQFIRSTRGPFSKWQVTSFISWVSFVIPVWTPSRVLGLLSPNTRGTFIRSSLWDLISLL